LTASIDLQIMGKKNGAHQLFGYLHSTKHHLLCSADERNSQLEGE